MGGGYTAAGLHYSFHNDASKEADVKQGNNYLCSVLEYFMLLYKCNGPLNYTGLTI